MLDDSDPRVRAAAGRVGEVLLGGSDRSEVLAKWIALTHAESSSEVQLQLALPSGEARDHVANLRLAALARRASDHPFLRDAALTGVGGRELELAEVLLAGAQDKADYPVIAGLAGLSAAGFCSATSASGWRVPPKRKPRLPSSCRRTPFAIAVNSGFAQE